MAERTVGNDGRTTPADPAAEAGARPGADARIPAAREQRDALRALATDYVALHRLVPPLPMDELRLHARQMLVRAGLPVGLGDFATVLLSNEIWRETVGRVPFERRVILLPQCLRDPAACPASMDAIGVLCEQCGRCPIGPLQEQAESLGYVVLVAEGTTVVTRLIESGKVDAVIGVSCLSVLERAFPHLAAEAIPGLAIPLLHDGCRGTSLDADWVRESIGLRSRDPWLTRGDLDRLRDDVQGWFAPAELDRRMGVPSSMVEGLERDWMLRGGKRWRPFLLAAAWRALRATEREIPEPVRYLALAVECFHKASLIHDDIEDADPERYGEATMHLEHGVPVAINVGDALLGEGYRLIARCGAPAPELCAMLEAAADGHRTLCLGQGGELAWMRAPEPLPPDRILDIFRQKTAPAFEVALRLGAIVAVGRDPALESVLREFSAALGAAYQIRDDLDDLDDPAALAGPPPRLSILSSLAWEAAGGAQRDRVAAAWLRPQPGTEDAAALAAFARTSGAADKALQLMEHFKNAAVRSLEPLQNVHLKTLLRRIVGRLVPRK